MLDILETINEFLRPLEPYMILSIFFIVSAALSTIPLFALGKLIVKLSPRERYCSALERKEKCERMAFISLGIFMIPALPLLIPTVILFIPLLLVSAVIAAVLETVKESFDDYLWKHRQKGIFPNGISGLIFGPKCVDSD